MQRSSDDIKGLLILAYQLLRAQVDELASLRVHTAVMAEYLGQHPQFRQFCDQKLAGLQKQESVDAAESKRRLDVMLRLLQET